MKKRILILGGGFAGVSAAKTLARQRSRSEYEIVLINDHLWHTFSPLLPDLLSGRIRPNNISYSLESFCGRRNIEFVRARVREIMPAEMRVATSGGDYAFDYLIDCLGCVTNYFGNDSYSDHAPGLKTIQDGSVIRRQARAVLGKSRENPQFRGHILLIGGGYTGFETASHLANHLRVCSGRTFESLRDLVQFTIAEVKPEVLGNVSPGVRDWATRLIGNFGVNIRTGYTVKEFRGDGNVVMSDGEVLRDTMAIWTAGVTPGPVNSSLGTSKAAHGRIEVNRYLLSKSYPNIYAAGDVAGAHRPGQDMPIRMSVQFSISGGTLAARNVLHDMRGEPLESFDPFDPGYVIPLAPGKGTGVVFGREFHGRMPFILHYLISIYRSMGFANKYNVFRDLMRELRASR